MKKEERPFKVAFSDPERKSVNQRKGEEWKNTEKTEKTEFIKNFSKKFQKSIDIFRILWYHI